MPVDSTRNTAVRMPKDITPHNPAQLFLCSLSPEQVTTLRALLSFHGTTVMLRRAVGLSALPSFTTPRIHEGVTR